MPHCEQEGTVGMNEQEAMARLAAANPVPDHLATGSGPSSQAKFCLRTVLAQTPARPAPPPRGRRPARFVLIPAVLITVAGAGVVAVQHLRSDRVPPPPATQVAAPATIFAAAAEQAQRSREAGQFRHVTGTVGRVVHVDSAGGYNVIRVDSVQSVWPAGGRPGEGWLAVGEQGSSVRPLTAADAAAYRADGAPDATRLPRESGTGRWPDLADDPEFDGRVADLPVDPAGAARAMVDRVAGDGGSRTGDPPSPGPADVDGWLFRECTRLLDTFTDLLAGADRAKVFRILAGLTGVRTLAAPTDPMGRPAIGLAYTGTTPRHGVIDWQIFLRSGTDRIIFTQAVVRRPGPANATLGAGTVQYSTAVTQVTYRDKP
jgi:hypothetical protein